ncbi:MAG: response regulator [bacterium]
MELNILLVDDEPEIVSMIERNLSVEGYELDGVTSPEIALEKIKSEDYNIVITDIKMPEIDGVELLKRIKEIDGTIQVIMITGYVEMSHLVSSLSNGAVDCIFKPLDFDKLIEAIEHCRSKLERWEEALGQLRSIGEE